MGAGSKSARDYAGHSGAHTPKVGAIQICDAREYGYGAGFVIEQFSYWNQSEPFWAIPAWEESGRADLAGVFVSEASARAAIAKAEGRQS